MVHDGEEYKVIEQDSSFAFFLWSSSVLIQEDYIRQNQWCAHEQAIEECRQQGLVQAVYFLQRDLIYMRDVGAFTS